VRHSVLGINAGAVLSDSTAGTIFASASKRIKVLFHEIAHADRPRPSGFIYFFQYLP